LRAIHSAPNSSGVIATIIAAPTTKSSAIQPIKASAVTKSAAESPSRRTSASGTNIANTMAGMPMKWVARLRRSRW